MPIAAPDPVSASTSNGNAVKVIASPRPEMPSPSATIRKSRIAQTPLDASPAVPSGAGTGTPATTSDPSVLMRPSSSIMEPRLCHGQTARHHAAPTSV
jgi:hypothetical protein